MEDGPAKDAFVNALASFMKMAHRVWNEDKVPDEIIIQHVRDLSGGKINLTEIHEFAAHNENFQTYKQKTGGRDGKQNQKNKKHQKNFRKN